MNDKIQNFQTEHMVVGSSDTCSTHPLRPFGEGAFSPEHKPVHFGQLGARAELRESLISSGAEHILGEAGSTPLVFTENSPTQNPSTQAPTQPTSERSRKRPSKSKNPYSTHLGAWVHLVTIRATIQKGAQAILKSLALYPDGELSEGEHVRTFHDEQGALVIEYSTKLSAHPVLALKRRLRVLTGVHNIRFSSYKLVGVELFVPILLGYRDRLRIPTGFETDIAPLTKSDNAKRYLFRLRGRESLALVAYHIKSSVTKSYVTTFKLEIRLWDDDGVGVGAVRRMADLLRDVCDAVPVALLPRGGRFGVGAWLGTPFHFRSSLDPILRSASQGFVWPLVDGGIELVGFFPRATITSISEGTSVEKYGDSRAEGLALYLSRVALNEGHRVLFVSVLPDVEPFWRHADFDFVMGDLNILDLTLAPHPYDLVVTVGLPDGIDASHLAALARTGCAVAVVEPSFRRFLRHRMAGVESLRIVIERRRLRVLDRTGVVAPVLKGLRLHTASLWGARNLTVRGQP